MPTYDKEMMLKVAATHSGGTSVSSTLYIESLNNGVWTTLNYYSGSILAAQPVSSSVTYRLRATPISSTIYVPRFCFWRNDTTGTVLGTGSTLAVTSDMMVDTGGTPPTIAAYFQNSLAYLAPSPGGGVYPPGTDGGIHISFNLNSAGLSSDLTLRYTTDGSYPTATSTVWTRSSDGTWPLAYIGTTPPGGWAGPAITGTSGTLKMVLFWPDGVPYSYMTASGEYTIDAGTVPDVYPPVIQVLDQTGGSVPVLITCATAGATIYYTTTGATPSSTVGATYSDAFSVSSTTLVRAIAKNGTGTYSAVTDLLVTVVPEWSLSPAAEPEPPPPEQWFGWLEALSHALAGRFVRYVSWPPGVRMTCEAGLGKVRAVPIVFVQTVGGVRYHVARAADLSSVSFAPKCWYLTRPPANHGIPDSV